MISIEDVSNSLQPTTDAMIRAMDRATEAAVRGIERNAIVQGFNAQERQYEFYRVEYDGRNDWQNAFQEHVRAGWEHDYEAGMSIARSAGWAAAGQYDEAMGEAVNAVKELWEGWCEKMEFMVGK
jgi:hypothetical protein